MTELIVALDVDSADEALRLADELPDLRWAKVGPVLFVRSGPGIIRALRDRDVQVFLDLKWHDIPNSVAGAARAAAAEGVALATVHALGGPEMIAAARAMSGDMKLAAVSVLTSHSVEGYSKAIGRSTEGELVGEVVRLARLAVEAGADGVVSSPWEVAQVRAAVGDGPWIIVPGIRLAGDAVQDQRRTATPRSAARAGASHVVVGRPITRAERPAEVYNKVMGELS